MKLFHRSKDGGPMSNVTGYWLIEWKRFFSIALLRFSDGARDCYHSHAFNCISWVLTGALVEDRLLLGSGSAADRHEWREYRPSLFPVITTRDNLHRVHSIGTTWVLTFRGPWASRWMEYIPAARQFVTLTAGRKIVARQGATHE